MVVFPKEEQGQAITIFSLTGAMANAAGEWEITIPDPLIPSQASSSLQSSL